MKLYGFICNNCLDYISDMPWFQEAEAVDLKFVKTGAVVNVTNQH